MEKVIAKIKKIPFIIQLFLLVVVCLNLSLPIMKQVQQQVGKIIDEAALGLVEVGQTLQLENAKLIGTEQLIVNDVLTVGVLTETTEPNRIVYQEDYVEIGLNNHIQKIPYEQQMTTVDLHQEIFTVLQQLGLLSVVAGLIIGILMVSFILLILIVITMWMLKFSLKFKVLLPIILISGLIGSFCSLFGIMIIPAYPLVALTVGLVITGVLFASCLKQTLSKNITAQYLGGGENNHELYRTR